MNHPTNPTEIARETLRRLAAGNLAPTPANYQACYHEIANLPVKVPFPALQLKGISAALSRKNAAHPNVFENLNSAIAKQSWHDVEKELIEFFDAIAAEEKETGQRSGSVLPADFSQTLARFIESSLPALGDKQERGPKISSELIQALRTTPVEIPLMQNLLASASPPTRFSAEEQAQIKNSLFKLMRLILENIGQLTPDESWLKGQVEGLLASIEPPIRLKNLDDMEQRLREVIVKQSEARKHSIQARDEMRSMLATFVESLATMNDTSTLFQEKIENSAIKMKAVKSIEDLGPLLKEVIEATGTMSEDTSQARHQLKSMQEKVAATEATLTRLYEELDHASAQARHDPLTDALNRKGLDDALNREIASLRRKNLPLSISLLDLDNFKKLNDRLGHEAGDKALVHLANVARQCMRPNDTLARYGGEEFVILMPDTLLEHGIEAMTRLQRELTRTFFLSDKENVLITFSAGVAQVGTYETGSEAINRADQAMYLAKRTGKNRVVGG